MEMYVIKIGEISLKGGNRRIFEKRLTNNIHRQLGDIHVVITGRSGRFYLHYDGDNPAEIEKIEYTLAHVFGIVAFSKTVKVEKNIDEIKKPVATLQTSLWQRAITRLSRSRPCGPTRASPSPPTRWTANWAVWCWTSIPTSR